MQPQNLETSDAGRALLVCWADGRRDRIDAQVLWSECPSAKGRRRRLDGLHLGTAASLTIVKLEPVGHYGINIAFSDGHDRGIYPWDLLAQLTQRPTPDDFIIADAKTDAPDQTT